MKPRDLLLTRIQRDLMGSLESLGFRNARSSITFRRKSGIARQKIAFFLDRHNSEDECRFWTVCSTRALSYPKWHEQQFGKPPGNDVLGSASEWNMKGNLES